MSPSAGTLDQIKTKFGSAFVYDQNGRIEAMNDPDRSEGPSLAICGYASGNLVRFGPDVDDDTAAAISELVATEPALASPDSLPEYQDRYMQLLDGEHQVPGVAYSVPKLFTFDSEIQVISSGTSDADRLVQRISPTDAFSSELRDMGFRGPHDFWEPWSAAMQGEQIAALAFAARLTDRSSEPGIVTVPSLRRQGFATSAVAAWAKHPGLGTRSLFYSTTQDNDASKAIAARLGFQFIGATFSVY